MHRALRLGVPVPVIMSGQFGWIPHAQSQNPYCPVPLITMSPEGGEVTHWLTLTPPFTVTPPMHLEQTWVSPDTGPWLVCLWWGQSCSVVWWCVLVSWSLWRPDVLMSGAVDTTRCPLQANTQHMVRVASTMRPLLLIQHFFFFFFLQARAHACPLPNPIHFPHQKEKPI